MREKSSAGKRLVAWLKQSYSIKGIRPTQAELGGILGGLSGQTIYRLTLVNGVSADTLLLIREFVKERPGSNFAIALINEMLDACSELPKLQEGSIVKAVRPEHLTPTEIIGILRDSDPEDELESSFLLEAATSMDALYFDGNLAIALEVIEELWYSLQFSTLNLRGDLISVGMVYARLLSAQGRYPESISVYQICLNAARQDGNRRMEGFLMFDLLSVIHKSKRFSDPCALHKGVLHFFIEAEKDLFYRADCGDGSFQSLVWPINYGHRQIAIMASRFVGRDQLLSSSRRDLLSYSDEALKASSSFVEKDLYYINANKVATTYVLSAFGNPVEALEKADELIASGQELWDHIGLLFSKTTALRIRGSKADLDEALKILDDCERISRPVGNTPHLTKIRQARRIIQNEYSLPSALPKRRRKRTTLS